MHDEARQWVESHVWPAARVLELGSRNLNGGSRDLFGPETHYWGIDVYDGPGVDEVAKAQNWTTEEKFDLVLCTEVLEHVEDWPLIVWSAARALREGGRAIFTMATDPRPPHSGIIPDQIQPGEYYGNVPAGELVLYLEQWFSDWTLDRNRTPGDLRVWATK